MKNRGFVITFDALIALGIALVLFTSTAYYLSESVSHETENHWLKQIASDSISILDKSGKLEQAILENDASKVRQFLNKMPYDICAEAIAYPDTNINNALLLVAKDNCETSNSEIVSCLDIGLIYGDGAGNGGIEVVMVSPLSCLGKRK